jgi:hypothetical protein
VSFIWKFTWVFVVDQNLKTVVLRHMVD